MIDYIVNKIVKDFISVHEKGVYTIAIDFLTIEELYVESLNYYLFLKEKKLLVIMFNKHGLL